MIKPRVLCLVAIPMLVGGPTVTFAQSDVRPPSAPGQNGPQTPGSGGQTLNASVSLTAVYDSDLSAQMSSAANYFFGPQLVTYSNQLLGNGQYQWRARDVQFRAYGTSQRLHDRQSGRVVGLNHSATGTLTARLPRRMTLLVDQTTTSTISPLYKLFPRLPAAEPTQARSATPDHGADDVHAYLYTAQATLAQALTRHSTLSVSATGEHGQTVRRTRTEVESELVVVGISTRFTHQLTRNAGAIARYSLRAGQFPEASVPGFPQTRLARGIRASEQTAEIGMSYGRPLSATRRMLFEVVLGELVLSPLEQPLTGALQFTDSHRIVGEAGATYMFGRTWQARASYRRGIDYVPGLDEPVLTEGFSGRMQGGLSRRIAMQATVGYASGTSALLPGHAAFDSYTSDVQVSLPLGRAVATYVQYVYYLYDFRRYGALVAGMPPALERNGLRVGLTLSVPTLEW